MAQAASSISRRNYSLGTLHPNSYGRGPNSNSGARFGRVAANGFSENIQLNKSITAMAKSLKDERNWDKWERLCEENLGKFNLVNCITAIYSAAVNVQDVDKPQFMHRYDRLVKDLLAKTSLGISSSESRNLANTINAMAKLQIKDDALIQKISRSAQRVIGTFKSQEVANTAWAFATMGITDIALFKALSKRSQQIISKFNAQDCANTAWAFATLGINDIALFLAINKRTQQISGAFNAQDCSNTTWAFATLGKNYPKLFEALSDRSQQIIRTFNAQNCANVASAFATVGMNDSRLFDALSARSQTIMGTFNSQGIASLLWAFGEARIVDDVLFQKVFNQLNIADLKKAEIDQVLRAIASLKVIEDRAFIAKIIEEVQKKKLEMGTDLTFSCWSLAVIFNLYDLSEQGPTPKELEILNEFLRELDEIKFQMNQKGEDFKEASKQQLTSVFLYLKHFHPDFYKPEDYGHIQLMVDVDGYLKEQGQSRPRSSAIHIEIHQKLEKLLKRDLLIEQLHAGYYLDTIVDEKSKVALEIVGLYHELSTGGMLGEDILRARILKKEGWNVLEVSVEKWRDLSDSEGDQYLLSLLPKEPSSSSSDSSESEDSDMSSDDDSKPVSRKRRRGSAGLEPLSPVSPDKKERI